MSIVVVLALWSAAALLIVLAFAFGAAVGRQRAHDEAVLARSRPPARRMIRRRSRPVLGPHRWPLGKSRARRRVPGSR